MPDAPFMLSVSGARGIVGQTMTPTVAAEFAAAFGSWIRSRVAGRPRLCVGRDGRAGGEALAAAARGSLAGVGCDVVDLGVTMTPTVGVMIGRLGCAGGMEITASHNPLEWNGLKCLDSDGLAPPPSIAADIIERFRRRNFAFVPSTDVGRMSADASGAATHVEKVLAQVDVAAIRSRRFRVALDSINGSGCGPGKMLLERLGCEVVHLNGEPTGIFAHVPEPTEANLGDLAAAVRSGGGFAAGFAQDPDGDRLAIVDGNGRYIGEEYTLVLAAFRLLQRRGKGTLAANLSTSRMIDDVAAGFPGSRVVRTAVGEANVVVGLKEHGGILGGEGNGGVILPEVCLVRDSLTAMALTLDLLAADGRPLAAIVDALPRYAMVKTKLDLAAVGGAAAIAPALAKVRAAFARERLDDRDGIRIDLADGWVHLRASNTEPIVRVIAEAPTGERAERLVAECRAAAGL
jgi:phosphomannomutase